MLKRAQQIVYGTVLIAVGGFTVVGPIAIMKEQPSTWLVGAGGGLIFIGLWLCFPVGMGQFGDWAAKKLPWLHDHEEES